MTTQEEEEFLTKQQLMLNQLQSNMASANLSALQQDQMIRQEEQNQGMLKQQLDLSEELSTMKHLLHGHVLEEKNGNMEWVERQDMPDLKVLSEYGVYLIMDAIISHTTKNTLLTNLDEDKINRIMIDFSEDLNDTIYMESEKVFEQPTLQDCKGELDKRIKAKVDKRMYAYELLGSKGDEQVFKKEFVKEMEHKIEKELDNISKQLKKNKYKRFLILMRMTRDFVEFALNRAYRGEERRTLRQHININENTNPANFVGEKPKKGGFLKFGR